MSFQFRPREAGSYMQCWQLKMEPALASAATARVLLKFDLCGQVSMLVSTLHMPAMHMNNACLTGFR